MTPEPEVDKSRLKEELDSTYKLYNILKDYITKNSGTRIYNAYISAGQVYNDPSATQTQVDQACSSLRQATAAAEYVEGKAPANQKEKEASGNSSGNVFTDLFKGLLGYKYPVLGNSLNFLGFLSDMEKAYKSQVKGEVNPELQNTVKKQVGSVGTDPVSGYIWKKNAEMLGTIMDWIKDQAGVNKDIVRNGEEGVQNDLDRFNDKYDTNKKK